MSEGKRPGGLTAMAVINFVLSGFAGLGVLGLLAFVFLRDRIDDPEFQKAVEQIPDGPIILVAIAMNIIVMGLLIISGIGYLKQRRVQGRVMGNIYALLALAALSIAIVMGQFTMLQMVDVIYPVLTLILLNTTFKDDLVR